MDGYISQSTNQVSTAWTSKADKHFFVELSTSLKYLVMGFNTWQTIKRPLPNRNIIVLSSAGNLEVDLNAPLCLCALPIPELIRQLEDKGVKHLCIAGGSGVYSQFLSLHLVDEVFLTIEPVFLGGGVPLFQNVYSPVKLDVKERFLISGQTQVIRAKPIYDKQFWYNRLMSSQRLSAICSCNGVAVTSQKRGERDELSRVHTKSQVRRLPHDSRPQTTCQVLFVPRQDVQPPVRPQPRGLGQGDRTRQNRVAQFGWGNVRRFWLSLCPRKGAFPRTN